MDTPLQSVTRRLVGAREVYLCDSLFDEATVYRVADLLKTLRYCRVERSRTDTDVSGGSAEVPEHVAKSEPLFGQMKAFAEQTFVISGLKPYRLYVNSTVYGDMYYPHRDSGEDEQHITVLYYANPKWSADWGGETILYGDDGDAQMAVTPRPGRILAFRGAILHRGGVPTRTCFEERLTIAYKLRVPEITAGGDATSSSSMEEVAGAIAGAIAANDYPLAARLAEETLSIGLIHPLFFKARALHAECEGRDEEALALYEQARTLTPRDANLLDAMGLCLTRLSRFQEAIYLFDAAIRIAPAHAPAHHWLGLVLGHAGRWDLAERAHARAAQLDPRHAEAIASLAAIAARKGDEKVARNQADRALKLDPSNATAHAALALVQSRTEGSPPPEHA